MAFGEECDQYFGTKNLYEILGVERSATQTAIKKAYRQLSLKLHPDRCVSATDEQLKVVTAKFQVLSKVHYVLSDVEKRSVYDETGMIVDEDTFDGDFDWDNYWRTLFPKITVEQINEFYDKYIGSEEEKGDLKKIYLRFKGDMDLICQCMIGFDEERTRDMLRQMIADGEVPEFDAFAKESEAKKSKRKRKAEKEAKEADQVRNEQPLDELVNAIQVKHKQTFNDMVSRLEEKYAKRHYEKKDKKPSKATMRKPRK